MTTVFDIWASLWTAFLGPQWGPLAWTLVKNTIASVPTASVRSGCCSRSPTP